MKLPHLESLRGVAAVVVVFSHVVWAFATPPTPRKPTSMEWPAGTALLHEPLRTTVKVAYWCVKSGRPAVFVFFALSGLVLAQSYLRSGRGAELRSGVLKRWPRLAIPATVASLLAWGAVAGGLRYTTEAADAQRAAGVSTVWLDMTAAPDAGAWDAFRQASYDFYFRATPTHPASLHNPALWTMRVEFHGSLLVFAFLALFGGHTRLLIFSAGGAVLLGLLGLVELGLFLGGVAISVTLVERPDIRLSAWLGVVLLTVGVYLGGTYGGFDGTIGLMPYFGTPFRPGEVRLGLGALLVVAAVALTPWLARLMSARPLVWLGGISFGVYLIHLVVLDTVGAWLIARTTPTRGWPAALGMATATTVTLSILGGWLMTLLVDRPAVRVSRWFARLILGPPLEAPRVSTDNGSSRAARAV